MCVCVHVCVVRVCVTVAVVYAFMIYDGVHLPHPTCFLRL